MARSGGRGKGRRVGTRVADASAMPLFTSAMKRVQPAEDLVKTGDRPEYVSSGLVSVDRALRGGVPVGGSTLVGARPRVGATSMLIGLALRALERGERVAYFSERLQEPQLRGRFVVLESRVNGYRFRAGFASAEDRLALAAARSRIAWNNLSLVTRRQISAEQFDSHIFSYRPMVVLADIIPRWSTHPSRTAEALSQSAQRLASMARRHQIALVFRALLSRGQHPPDLVELPGLGAAAQYFDAAILLHRQTNGDDPEGATVGDAEARIVRVRGRDVEPRVVPLRFDQRFAGLLELPSS